LRDLFDPPVRATYCRLGVFDGGWTLPAAEAACSTPGSNTDVLDDLSTLVESNLVRRQEGADGEPCYRMVETIRADACERLAVRAERDEVERARGAILLQECLA
jgi:hypothetical protein